MVKSLLDNTMSYLGWDLNPCPFDYQTSTLSIHITLLPGVIPLYIFGPNNSEVDIKKLLTTPDGELAPNVIYLGEFHGIGTTLILYCVTKIFVLFLLLLFHPCYSYLDYYEIITGLDNMQRKSILKFNFKKSRFYPRNFCVMFKKLLNFILLYVCR